MRGLVIRMVAVGVLSTALVSCAVQREVDYAGYERIPNTAASITFRMLAKSNPITGQRLFYGNYGGPGNNGGRPHDEMDELFRRHDIVYYSSDTKMTMRVADEELLSGLRSLETGKLDANGRKYRDLVMNFFESPYCKYFGKPWSIFYRRNESADCYFQSPEVVREFFSEEHPGMPEARGQEARSH